MKKRSTQGFTLIELLVASGVTAIIVGLMITMVSNLLTAYNRSSGALSAQSQAGFVLDQLTTELESLVVRNTNEVMLAAEIGPTSIAGSGTSLKPLGDSLEIEDVTPPSTPPDPPVDQGVIPPIEDQRFGVGGTWFRFFTSAPSLTNDPDNGVRAVGYQIALNPVTAGDGAPLQYMLYRKEVSARDTFDIGYQLDPDASDYGYAGTALTTFSDDQIIAGNVVDFGVRLFGTNAYRERELLFPLGEDPSDLEYFASGTGPDGYPRSAEIMIRILTPEGVRLLEAMRDGNFDGDWWTVVDQNSEVFSRVINIPSRPL